MEAVTIPLRLVRACARAPRFAYWHGHNIFEIRAVVVRRLAPGWPMRARVVNLLES